MSISAASFHHAALRVFVMGERGVTANRRPPPTSPPMSAIAQRAVEAGALGFTTSRTLNHRTSDGAPTPTLTAGEDELSGIAMGLAAAGKGVLQFVSDFTDPKMEFSMLRRIAERSGRPLSFTLAQGPLDPRAGLPDLLLDGPGRCGCRRLADEGAGRCQARWRASGIGTDRRPFGQCPAYREIAGLSLAERVERLSSPGFLEALLAEPPRDGVRRMPTAWGRMHLLSDPPDYEPAVDTTVGAIAAARGVQPEAVALEHMLERGGRGMLYVPFLNYAEGSLDAVHAMICDPEHPVPGLSDGGAHVGMICDGSFPTSMITHWTRDRTRGPKLPLEAVIKLQTQDTARTVGLHDRGLIAPGYRDESPM